MVLLSCLTPANKGAVPLTAIYRAQDLSGRPDAAIKGITHRASASSAILLFSPLPAKPEQCTMGRIPALPAACPLLPSGACAYLLECFAHLLRETGRPAGRAVYVDVDEVALGRGGFFVVAEEPYLVADAAVAEPGDAQACVHDVGEDDGLEEPTLRLDDEADDGAPLDI